MNGQHRKDIYPGLQVAVILKQDQRTGKLTKGIVRNILTNSPFHSRGIKVRLEDGQIGRVHALLTDEPAEFPFPSPTGRIISPFFSPLFAASQCCLLSFCSHTRSRPNIW